MGFHLWDSKGFDFLVLFLLAKMPLVCTMRWNNGLTTSKKNTKKTAIRNSSSIRKVGCLRVSICCETSSVLLRRHLWQRIGCLTRRNHITLPVARATVELEGSLEHQPGGGFQVCFVGWWNTVQQKNEKTTSFFQKRWGKQTTCIKQHKLNYTNTKNMLKELKPLISLLGKKGSNHVKPNRKQPCEFLRWGLTRRLSFCTLTWQGKIPQCMIGHASSKNGPFSSHLCEFFFAVV